MFFYRTGLGIITIVVMVMSIPVLIVTAEAATISGQITSQLDGTALGRATVTVRPIEGGAESITAAADDTGNFILSNLAAAEYVVTVTFVGFSTGSFQVRVTADENLTHDVSLTALVIDLQSISVTASRTPEKLVDAPAAVHVVNESEAGTRATLTPTEHIKGMPAVDVATTGLNQSNIVVRGFNNIFSGALLVMVDNRIASVPSLRFNAYHFIPTPNEDIERIEVVSGPGSALYGPNAATGVLHMLSKSPFAENGTTVSMGGGERGVLTGSFRHSGSYNGRVGYKVTGQYYRGLDWKEQDPLEPDSIRFFRPSVSGPIFESDTIPNERNFNLKKISGEGRVDFLLDNNTSLIVNGGFNQANNIELTGIGAAQAIDWTNWYTQARMKYKDLFMQTYVNASDAGDTYLLRSGQLVVDRSKLWAAQIQHRYSPSDRLGFTYGLDALFTRPETEATINGRNEESDNTDEVGVYTQADYNLSDMFRLVGALRLDHHDRLDEVFWSPRLGLVCQPNRDQSLRGTYNRAFQTPDNNSLYLDVLQEQDPFKVGAAFESELGFSPAIDIRVQGVPSTGFHWSFDANGNPRFRSSFAPLDPRGLSSNDFIDFNDPVFTNVMWQLGRGVVISSLPDTLSNCGFDSAGIDSFITAVENVVNTTVSGVNNSLMTFNPDNKAFEPTTRDDIADIDPLKPTITETFEIGYKGIVNDRIQISADVYATRKFDFIGPLTVETPNVFLDPVTLQSVLAGNFANAYDSASASDQAVLDQLDLASCGGNGNGTPVDELTVMFTSGAAAIPFGTANPIEVLDPSAVLITYRNFGEITFYGADFAVDVQLNRFLAFRGTYSYVSKNFFAKGTDQVHDIYLNAPKHKYGIQLRYTNQKWKLMADSRLRWVDAFDMVSPFIGSSVGSFAVLDANFDWQFLPATHLTLTIQNILNNQHNEFVGAPRLGRLVIGRLTHSF